MAAVAAEIAPLVAHGAIVSLEGDLGAGKTALARALIRHLTGDPTLEVPSPTFTLLQTYDAGGVPVWHFDFYRLKLPDDVYELGWEDALASGGLLLLEWAQRIAPLLPPGVMRVMITPEGEGRKIEVRA